MKNDLISFWDEAALAHAPFIHPRDNIPNSQIQSDVRSYAEYLSAFERDTLAKSAFHLGLLPQPYHGDLDNAEVLLLLINPGLSASDYYAEARHPDFRESLVDSIRQVRRSHMFLDPKWAWTSGFAWWEGKLRDVAKLIAKERFEGHYGRALADLAQRIASIELVPYHSSIFGGSKRLASADAARCFVNSVDASRTIIVTRGVTDWGLPNAPNIIKYPTTHARSASLGRYSVVGQAILARYGITDTSTA